MKAYKDNKVIITSEKAYRLIYEPQGYTLEPKIKEDNLPNETVENESIDLEKLKVDELKDLAKKYEIDIPTKMNKTEIIELLRGVINGADAN